MSEMFLPTLSYFEHKNVWTGSAGNMRYRISPEESLRVEVWPGPWCYELSEMEAAAEFPLSQEGLQALRDWLAVRAGEINSRPVPTYEQLRAQFAAKRAEQQT